MIDDSNSIILINRLVSPLIISINVFKFLLLLILTLHQTEWDANAEWVEMTCNYNLKP